MHGDQLRSRCADLLDEIRGARTDDDAIDGIIAAFTQLQQHQLTPDERRSLAMLFGYELAGDEGVLEVANVRRLLAGHGVLECDRHGEVRSTIAMVEDALVTRRRG